MRKKTAVNSVKWTEKNRIYLERLGILDGRTGATRKNTAVTLNSFVNFCITTICESQSHDRSKPATCDELTTAWIKAQAAQRNKEIDRLNQEIVMLSKRLPAKKELEEAMERLI